MIDLPGYTKEGLPALQKRCEELAVQPRGTRGESGGFDGEYFRCLLLTLRKNWPHEDKYIEYWQGVLNDLFLLRLHA